MPRLSPQGAGQHCLQSAKKHPSFSPRRNNPAAPVRHPEETKTPLVSMKSFPASTAFNSIPAVFTQLLTLSVSVNPNLPTKSKCLPSATPLSSATPFPTSQSAATGLLVSLVSSSSSASSSLLAASSSVFGSTSSSRPAARGARLRSLKLAPLFHQFPAYCRSPRRESGEDGRLTYDLVV